MPPLLGTRESRQDLPVLGAVLIALHLGLIISRRLLRDGIRFPCVGFDAGETGVFPQDQDVPRDEGYADTHA
jgi:hypothetical protein